MPTGRGCLNLAHVLRDPAGGFNSDGRVPDESGELRFELRQLFRTQLPLPLVSKFVENPFTLAHDLPPERRDLEALPASVTRVRAALDLASVNQQRNRLRGGLLRYRQPAA